MVSLIKEFDFLSEEFLNDFKKIEPKWGFSSGPNSVGEITYRRTYSRDGEEWWETVRRVVEGTYDILYSHCKRYRIPFDLVLAKSDAEKMYNLIFNFKFLPPGRGLWMQGVDYIWNRTSAALNNCGMCSTRDIDTEFEKPFTWAMDMLMLGVGVGFDNEGANKIFWEPTTQNSIDYVIPDSREGWVDSLGALLRWGFGIGPKPLFDYSLIRPRGSKIKGFGGVSEGPEPLKKLHDALEAMALKNIGDPLTSRHITDIMNLIGCCVVAGNVRRSALISFGQPDDETFLNLKNYDLNPERSEFGWASNNSIFAEVGMDYTPYAQRIIDNGEPGFAWLDNMRGFSRMNGKRDDKDWRVVGGNPCLEQSLENYELCCLVETFPFNHKTLDEYKETLKYAFIYAKAVTLLPTHSEETNAVMMRNRRIGTSMSGVAQFIAHRGEKTLIRWCKTGYETIEHYDKVYSEWLGVRESIKKTSIKPSGTVSLLAGSTPGAHYPTHRHYIRRIRFADSHPDLAAFEEAGYNIEPDVYSAGTMVVSFPVAGDEKVPTEKEVSLAQKMSIAALLQEYWADNQVSCTATFDPDSEGKLIPDLLKAYDTRLKGISFLPMKEEGAYPQMPYEPITKERYEELVANLKKINWTNRTTHDMVDAGCDGLACELPSIAAMKEKIDSGLTN